LNEPFRVGVTRDFLKPDGEVAFGDIGLGLLDEAPDVRWEFLVENTRELGPEQVRGYDALLVLAPKVTAATLEGADRLLIVARFGVGYDNVDVEACTRAGVLLTITPEGVRRPVALAAITLLLALSHKLLVKDRLTRAGRWAEKLDHMGQGVTGRVLGIVGLGNIGSEVSLLARPLGLRCLASDPRVSPAAAAEAGAELVEFEDLLRRSDFVCLTCALTEETRHLLDAARIGLMKPTAYLINVARGPIVDQKALLEALRAKRIQGAGLDVFEEEPVDPRDPILELENVILSPHAISWTDECFHQIGMSGCRSILEVAAGRIPIPVVNVAVRESRLLQDKLARIRRRSAPSSKG
jgi:phosphoglycerate dehydrogenase-like enzyme